MPRKSGTMTVWSFTKISASGTHMSPVGRALAVMLARNSIHAIQGELETLKTGRAEYAHDPYGLIAASHVVAAEFATIAAANNYWR